MAIAMGHIASGMISIGDPKETEETINAPATDAELQMMQKINLTDEENCIDRAGV
jgi:hypothetical protein